MTMRDELREGLNTFRDDSGVLQGAIVRDGALLMIFSGDDVLSDLVEMGRKRIPVADLFPAWERWE